MPTTRSYNDLCPIARALDVVGERWALVVVRELLLGPQRFADLRAALPGASSNMLTDRLRELEQRGVVRRRTLRPPAASKVYELTERGRALEPVLDALGAWGADELPPADGSVSASSMMIYLRARGTPSHTYRIELDDRVWTLSSGNVEPGETAVPDAGIATDPATLNELLRQPESLDDAIAGGRARVDGDVERLRELLAVPEGQQHS